MPPNPSTSAHSASCSRSARLIWLPRQGVRRALFLSAYVSFCLGLCVGAAALYWKLHAGVAITDTVSVWDHFYPELRASELHELSRERDDGIFDVLLLGGSVLEPTWGEVEAELRSRLERECDGKYRLINLARSGHTSRDSLLKYGHLEDARFDLVINYDGINDVRMNNCPRENFRDDYSHCAWYRSFEKRLAAGSISLPQAVLQEIETLGESIGRGPPTNDTEAGFGCDVKTPGPFRKNLEAILETAAKRGDIVLLQTFAFHLPDSYTRERFERGELDFTLRADGRSCAAEMWSKPECIGPVVDAQNAEVRSLVAEHDDVLFVDQAKLMQTTGENFVDVCHLTPAGSRRLIENLWPAVEDCHKRWQSQLTGGGNR